MNNYKWQPIETAPKKGSYWLYGKQSFKDKPEMVLGWYEKRVKKFYFADGYGYVNSIEPTHWMPLPKPPIINAK